MAANKQMPSYYPARVPAYVPLMEFASDVDERGFYEAYLGTPATADADGIIAAQNINSPGSTSTFATTYSNQDDNLAEIDALMGKFGRCLTIVASGAATDVITVTGRDYLNQKMVESLTLNGTNAVAGLKAFKWVDLVSWPDSANVTIDLGWGDVLGLPYRSLAKVQGLCDGVADAGTFVKAIDTNPQTATTGDPRGTWDPTTGCNGTREFKCILIADRANLHGVAHYAG